MRVTIIMYQKNRVADPGGFYPDLDPTFKKKPDSDPRQEEPYPGQDSTLEKRTGLTGSGYATLKQRVNLGLP